MDADIHEITYAHLHGLCCQTEALTPQEFHQQLLWFMAADPWPGPGSRAAHKAALDEQAQRFGFTDWLDAWHRYNPAESELDALLRIAYVPGADGR